MEHSVALNSSIVLNEITVIDHAFIDSFGIMSGGSLFLSVVVTGKVDGFENVVVDFSQLKKIIKGHIDSRTSGFDHKLWITNDFGKNDELSKFVYRSDLGRADIVTSAFEISVPIDALRVIDCNYNNQGLSAEISAYLDICLAGDYPDLDLKTEVYLSNTPRILSGDSSSEFIVNNSYCMFNYVHGLKNSTSWACQNIAHGHRSFIQAVRGSSEDPNNAKKRDTDKQFLRSITKDLNNTVFIWDENIDAVTEDTISIAYATRERGVFKAKYNTRMMKVKVLKNETTIELLIEHIISTYGKRFLNAGINRIIISEGLNKGALIKI